MKRIVVAGWMLLFIALGVAQDDKKKTQQSIPDLSGAWLVDEGKSDRPLIGSLNKKPTREEKSLIEHRDPEIKITRQICRDKECFTIEEMVFFSDGRGEKNAERGQPSFDSVTKWDGKKLVTKIPGKSKNRDVFFRWELSKDGKQLTRTFSGPNVPSSGLPGEIGMMLLLTKSKLVMKRIS